MKNLTIISVFGFLSFLTHSYTQNVFIYPTEYTKIEGPEKTEKPFGVVYKSKDMRKFRYQVIAGPISNNSLTIRRLGIRRDGTITYDWQWYTLELEIAFSTSPKTPATASATFSQNIGKDTTIMLPRTTIYFPTSYTTRSLPEPFEYIFPFG